MYTDQNKFSMPTPSDDTFQLSSHHLERSIHTTCPPDYDRSIEGTEVWRALAERPDNHALFGDHTPQLPPDDAEMTGLTNDSDHEKNSKFDDAGYSLQSSNASSPMPLQTEPKEMQDAQECLSPSPSPLPSIRGSTVPSSIGYEFSSVRVRTLAARFTKAEFIR